MPIAFPCTGCGVTLQLVKPPAAGAKIKCPKCGVATAVPMADTKPVARRPVSAPVAHEPEPPDRDDDVGDDIDDDRPTRRREGKRFKKKKRAKSGSGLLIGAGIGAGVLVIGVGITLAVIFWPKSAQDKETLLAKAGDTTPPAGRTTPPTRPDNSNPSKPPGDSGVKRGPKQPPTPPENARPVEGVADDPPAAPPRGPSEPTIPPTADSPPEENPARPPKGGPGRPPAAPPAADNGSPVEGFNIGNLAPEIQGEDIDGKKFKLSDYRGKVVVLDFWGHW